MRNTLLPIRFRSSDLTSKIFSGKQTLVCFLRLQLFYHTEQFLHRVVYITKQHNAQISSVSLVLMAQVIPAWSIPMKFNPPIMVRPSGILLLPAIILRG